MEGDAQLCNNSLYCLPGYLATVMIVLILVKKSQIKVKCSCSCCMLHKTQPKSETKNKKNELRWLHSRRAKALTS